MQEDHSLSANSFPEEHEMSQLSIRKTIGILLGLVIAFAQVSTTRAADSSLDLTFGNGGKLTTDFGISDDEGYAIAVQPDSKIVVAGKSFNGSNFDFALTRYHRDGSLDMTFDIDGKVTTDFGGPDFGNAVAMQTDGKILLGGSSFDADNCNFALARYNSDGSPDRSFGIAGKVITNFDAFAACDGLAIVLQPDGKIILGGYSSNDIALARYNSNGLLDTTFDTDGKVTTDFGGLGDVAYAVALQPDGKIVVAGTSSNDSNNDFALARFNSNGSLDTTFDTDGKVTTEIGGPDDRGKDMTLQLDGKILVAGHAFNGISWDFALLRYNNDGSLDTTFDSDGKVTTDFGNSYDLGDAIALQPDGKIVMAGFSEIGDGDFALARYNSDGSLDTTFDTDGKVTTDFGSQYDVGNAVTLQPDGKIVVVGRSFNGSDNDFALARYESTGSAIEVTLDVRPGKFPNRIELEKNVCKDDDNLPVAILTTPEFDALRLVDATSLQMGDPAQGGTAAPVHSQGRDIDRDGDRDVWLLFSLCDLVTNEAIDQGSTELVLSGMTLDGIPFTARDTVQIIGHKPPEPIVPVFDYPVDGQILDYEGSYLFRVQPIPAAEGFLWGFFQNGVMVWENYRDEGVLSGNEYGIHPGTLAHSKFVPGPVEVWVRASINGQWTDAAVITIHLQSTSGPLDPTFGSGGRVTTPFGNDNDYGFTVALQPDGKILMGGTDWGSTPTPIGHVNFALARYNGDGSLDPSFGVDGQVSTDFNNDDDFGNDIAVQPDGKILMTGQTFLLHSGYLFGLVRYNVDGTLDNTFGTDGKATTAFGFGEDYGGEIALQPNGKILVVGSSEQGGHWDFALARYNSDGSLDTTFSADGKVITDFSGRNEFGMAVALQPDGRIVVAGRSESGNNVDFALARYNSDGTLDNTFGGSGWVVTDFAKGDFGYAVALQPDGKIILAGAILINDGGDFALARYNSDGSLDTGFDTDGIVTTDLSAEDTAHDVILQPDGKIVLAGTSLSTNASAPMNDIVHKGGGDSSHDFALARYNTDGSLDVTLDVDGIIETDFSGGDDASQAAALQQDGKVILAGYSHNGIDYDFALARYHVGAAVQEVTIDIKPGSETNRINPNSGGRINVAILSTPEFDALTMIRWATIRFGRTGEEESLSACKTKGRDVNHDSLPDLICMFSIPDARFMEGDTAGILTAQTVDGLALLGMDSIRVGRQGQDD
jgi:uncharacterized delta-60 repeat protein